MSALFASRVLMVALLLLLQASANAACAMYTVKPNGTQLTRPAYTMTDGKLIKSKERAPVGATCDLTKPTKPSGKDLYASYDSTGPVALCSKR